MIEKIEEGELDTPTAEFMKTFNDFKKAVENLIAFSTAYYFGN